MCTVYHCMRCSSSFLLPVDSVVAVSRALLSTESFHSLLEGPRFTKVCTLRWPPAAFPSSNRYCIDFSPHEVHHIYLECLHYFVTIFNAEQSQPNPNSVFSYPAFLCLAAPPSLPSYTGSLFQQQALHPWSLPAKPLPVRHGTSSAAIVHDGESGSPRQPGHLYFGPRAHGGHERTAHTQTNGKRDLYVYHRRYFWTPHQGGSTPVVNNICTQTRK